MSAVENSTSRIEQLFTQLNLPVNSLKPEEVEKLRTLLVDFSDVFALSDAELGCTDVLQHPIDTGEHAAIKQQPYRTPIVRREIVSQMIDAMEAQGVVQPSVSPWASPVVLVPKKDGSWRFCVDYRRLNSVTRKDVYPLPRVDDILAALGGTKYFSTLDLASGYWQVEMTEDARSKTAFTTFKGLFEFTRMPFGLCNAPATFQRVMQRVLAGLEWKTCFVYIDDVLVASKTFEEHLQHLRDVFLRLRSANLRLKPKKCGFLRDKIPFLGHIISRGGILPDPRNTEKVVNYPRPMDATGVRRFMGLASYYRRFVPGFATIAAPLHALTKKHSMFEWTSVCEESFTTLKNLLASPPILVYPKFGASQSFVLETDASTVGLGAVLSQEQDDGTIHPVAYASRSVDKHERNYGISELKTLGLVWALRYFRHYLIGHPCLVYTDHAACLSILNTAKPSGKLARWALTVQEMDVTIRHKSGKRNSNADALSRCPADVQESLAEEPEDGRVCSVEGQVTDQVLLPDLKEVAIHQQNDVDMSTMVAYLKSGVLAEDEKLARRVVLESKQFELVDGVLYHENPVFPGRWCLVVPRDFRTDGLVEKFNSTLINMIAKSCEVKNRDWNERLPYLLFAYRVSAQESTKESPFCLLYGRDPRIPTETVVSYVCSPYVVDLDEYKEEFLNHMSHAWKLALENIQKAQVTQKKSYDKKAREVDLKVGERVMVLMPSETQEKNWKLARPFHSPYRVIEVTPSNAEVRLIDEPGGGSIFVALDRVRRCYPNQGGETWTGPKKKRRCRPKKVLPVETSSQPQPYQGPVTRSRSRELDHP